MLLTSEPGRTFAIGIDGKGLEPQDGEPAFTFQYLSGREARCCRDLDEKIPTIGMTNEQAAALYAKLREHMTGWARVTVKGKPVAYNPDDLDVVITDGEVKLVRREHPGEQALRLAVGDDHVEVVGVVGHRLALDGHALPAGHVLAQLRVERRRLLVRHADGRDLLVQVAAGPHLAPGEVLKREGRFAVCRLKPLPVNADYECPTRL